MSDGTCTVLRTYLLYGKCIVFFCTNSIALFGKVHCTCWGLCGRNAVHGLHFFGIVPPPWRLIPPACASRATAATMGPLAARRGAGGERAFVIHSLRAPVDGRHHEITMNRIKIQSQLKNVNPEYRENMYSQNPLYGPLSVHLSTCLRTGGLFSVVLEH